MQTETRLKAELVLAAVELMGRAGRLGTVRVQGESMNPTLRPGQLLAVDFSPEGTARGDMLLFRQGDLLLVHRRVASAPPLDGRSRFRTRGDGVLDLDPPVDPFVRRFRRSGRQRRSLPVPDKFKPDPAGTIGIRFNLAFESLTAPPGGGELVTATEGALRQDGPEADLDRASLARMLRFDLGRRRAVPRGLLVPESDDLVAPHAHGALAVGVGKLDADLGEGPALTEPPQRLGVDQDTVHVEDHRSHRALISSLVRP